MSFAPLSLQHVAVVEENPALPVELTVHKIALVPAAVSPLELARPIHHIVLEEAGEGALLGGVRPLSFLFAVLELTFVGDLAARALIFPVTVHQSILKLSLIHFWFISA